MGRIGDWFRNKFKKQTENYFKHPIRYNGEKLSISIDSMEGFTREEIKKYTQAVEILVHVVNSQEFRNEVIYHKPFEFNNGLTNKEIYDRFMSGADSWTGVDNTLNIKITIYYSNNRTVGYTYPSTSRTWVNRKFFRYYSLSSIVNNIVHENCHNIGFNHEVSGYSRDNVPYALGDIAGELADLILKGEKLTPISDF